MLRMRCDGYYDIFIRLRDVDEKERKKGRDLKRS